MVHAARGARWLPRDRISASVLPCRTRPCRVLVILALVGQMLADATVMSGVLAVLARNGIWLAAILMPAGFFLSATGRDVAAPNRLIWVVYGGALSLAIGAVSLGVGLLTG